MIGEWESGAGMEEEDEGKARGRREGTEDEEGKAGRRRRGGASETMSPRTHTHYYQLRHVFFILDILTINVLTINFLIINVLTINF